MKRSAAFAALCFLLLAGCTPERGSEETAAVEAAQANAQQQALERAEQAGLLAQQAPVIAAEQAETQVAALLAEYGCTAARTEDTLSVGDGAAAHDYYVFAVRDAAGGETGKLAVDCVTGEVYHYLGDGVLEALSTFPAGQRAHGWPGVYAGPVQRTLEITQTDEQTIAYVFSDGTAGTASVAGHTAKSADGEINFLLADQIVTVAGSGLTGNYTIQPQTEETLPSAE